MTVVSETSSWTCFQALGMLLPAHALQASQRMNSSCGMENMEMSFDRRCKEVSEERFVVRRLREYVSPLRVLRSRRLAAGREVPSGRSADLEASRTMPGASRCERWTGERCVLEISASTPR